MPLVDDASKPILNVGCSEFISILTSKFRRDLLTKKFLQKISQEICKNTIFIKELSSVLFQCKLAIIQTRRIICLSTETQCDDDYLSWTEITNFVCKHRHADFLTWSTSNNTSDSESLQKMAFSELAFRIFKVKMLPKVQKHFFENGAIPHCFLFPVENWVFFRFLFLSLPVDLDRRHEEMTSAVQKFHSFFSYSKFIYSGMFKYYLVNLKAPIRLTKYFNNCGLSHISPHPQGSQRTSRLTFFKLLYFTGLFDRRGHVPGIYLPLPVSIRLISRLNKASHSQLTSGSRYNEISEYNSPVNCSFIAKEAHIAEEMFFDIEDSDLEPEIDSEPRQAQVLRVPVAALVPQVSQSRRVSLAARVAPVPRVPLAAQVPLVSHTPEVPLVSQAPEVPLVSHTHQGSQVPQAPLAEEALLVPHSPQGPLVPLSPMVLDSHSPVFEEASPLSVETVPRETENTPERLSVSDLKEQLLEILDNVGKVELVDKMIFDGVDEALLTKCPVAELEHFFVDSCKMSLITARTVATKLKRHFK